MKSFFSRIKLPSYTFFFYTKWHLNCRNINRTFFRRALRPTRPDVRNYMYCQIWYIKYININLWLRTAQQLACLIPHVLNSTKKDENASSTDFKDKVNCLNPLGGKYSLQLFDWLLGFKRCIDSISVMQLRVLHQKLRIVVKKFEKQLFGIIAS